MSIRSIVSSLQVLVLLLASAPAVAGEWRDSVAWQGRSAKIEAIGDGRYRLRADGEGEPAVSLTIAAQPLRSETASPLFDGLFALAQQELQENRVSAIRDDAFNHGKPLPCDCFQTGARWPYVWTRDLSYSADLALARLDPERTKRSLRFKLSDIRAADVAQGLYVAQDTGSGGSWPISTDRVVWFLGARHLLDDPVFADETWRALRDTLTQDRAYAFDPAVGLYRGETSFLDWREQTYPAWTANDVVFIAESFALSTNVLHYQALQLAAELAAQRGDAAAAAYREQARALAQAIDRRFWNERRGMYMSYVGTAAHPVPFEAYDLLGISLAALSGAVPQARVREALANYPATSVGSPVIWPQQPGIAIYHNRAIWPFVSAYALKAARRTNSPARIAHELRSILRGAALAGSHMENYEFLSQRVHVEDGKLSGPVVNSPRQLWSVAGALDAVIEGVFGLEADGSVAPRLPTSLLPMLFGDRDAIRLQLQDRSIVLRRPRSLDGNLLVAGAVSHNGSETIVQLVPKRVSVAPLKTDAPQFAPPAPPAPVARRSAHGWQLDTADADTLYVDGVARGAATAPATLAAGNLQQCVSTTRRGADGIESLHSPTLCLGEAATIAGTWPRRWTAPHNGRYRALLHYDNPHGPINTGITAAVKRLSIRCGAQPEQLVPIVMPHSVGSKRSTSVVFSAKARQTCVIALQDGANMSDLRHFARYTGGEGGAKGALNAADIGALEIARER